MGVNDSLKCPGLDRPPTVIPDKRHCPQCGEIVEIWSDQVKLRCAKCGMVVYNPDPLIAIPDPKTDESNQVALKSRLDELIDLAIHLGGSAATVVDARDILVEDYLANLCREAKCPNYGLSPTCPPHVEGPQWLRRYIKKTPFALVLEIEGSEGNMYSDRRREIGQLLHFIVGQLEITAREKGFLKARGFAGGSCKNLFCYDHAYCRVLSGNGTCRNPGFSRPSVSGYGINMNHLLKITGWAQRNSNAVHLTSSKYGIVFLG
ncbi:DUF2284 domain-containing protein [Desulfosarcina ovata]|uniref:DUF2284 domain-containing protein n=1 Tax=Desulfosarcina ovata subsp. ovata TaxID=2752305 RepID=A0A5K8AF31_9BACT|nr:DUF2284 domain-containing protein [Desulfosarcina ovata]BBO90540.1 hypothetical protein DSCOOX_37200 [Desulfosarcina ovata subsp. ovata]